MSIVTATMPTSLDGFGDAGLLVTGEGVTHPVHEVPR